MGMTTRSTEVRFLTPAFLGNAAQSGQWRTPPFKALLRQWWRVAMAEQYGFRIDHREQLCRLEADLFGSAAGNQGQRSRVRLRLSRWDEGTLKKEEWRPLGKIDIPSKKKLSIDAGLYLGYGPLAAPNGKLSKKASIKENETASLHLAYPEEHRDALDRAINLMGMFGTIGGRSRNGWGSFALESTELPDDLPLRDWRTCLELDWAHAIGKDEKGALVWQTRAYDDWRHVMKQLAQMRMAVRRQFPFSGSKVAKKPEPRHWLSYPVTQPRVAGWGDKKKGNERIPNSLRFKVLLTPDKQLRGLIYHMPCRPSKSFDPDLYIQQIERVWQQVHRYLDNAGLERIKG